MLATHGVAGRGKHRACSLTSGEGCMFPQSGIFLDSIGQLSLKPHRATYPGQHRNMPLTVLGLFVAGGRERVNSSLFKAIQAKK
jgi:hypothetical protein